MSDSDRKQFVQIHGDKSHTCSIMSGVPQGSILVPTLLSLYVNDFPDFITPGELTCSQVILLYLLRVIIFFYTIIKTIKVILDQVFIRCSANRLITYEIKSEALLHLNIELPSSKSEICRLTFILLSTEMP